MITRLEAGVPNLESAIAIWMSNATIANYFMNTSNFDDLWEEAEQIR